jgi:hypothetical protein
MVDPIPTTTTNRNHRHDRPAHDPTASTPPSPSTARAVKPNSLAALNWRPFNGRRFYVPNFFHPLPRDPVFLACRSSAWSRFLRALLAPATVSLSYGRSRNTCVTGTKEVQVSMATKLQSADVALNHQDAEQLFDRIAQKNMHIPGEEFLRRWDAGVYKGVDWDSVDGLVPVAMAVRLLRS